MDELETIKLHDIRSKKNSVVDPKHDDISVLKQKQYHEDISNGSKPCIPESEFVTSINHTVEDTQEDTKTQTVNKSFSLMIKNELREVADIIRNPLFFVI